MALVTGKLVGVTLACWLTARKPFRAQRIGVSRRLEIWEATFYRLMAKT
jgi:hypothetical protein